MTKTAQWSRQNIEAAKLKNRIKIEISPFKLINRAYIFQLNAYVVINRMPSVFCETYKPRPLCVMMCQRTCYVIVYKLATIFKICI